MTILYHYSTTLPAKAMIVCFSDQQVIHLIFFFFFEDVLEEREILYDL